MMDFDTERLQKFIDDIFAYEDGDDNCENQTRKISLKKDDYEKVISTPGTHCYILCPVKLLIEKHLFFHSTSGNKYLLWWSDFEKKFTRVYSDVGEITVIDTDWILSQTILREKYNIPL